MKSIIVFNLLAITTINPIVNAHENHDHQIYNWPTSKNKIKESDATLNVETLEDKTKTNIKRSWIKFLEDKSKT